MNDKLILENVLLLLKGCAEVYVHGTEEASNKIIHETLKDGLDDILKMQHEVYEEMVASGWYKIQNIKSEEITKALDKLNKEA